MRFASPITKDTNTHSEYIILIAAAAASASLGATTSIFECFGLLSIWFPLITIPDAANPIPYFQFLHAISSVIFPSVLWSPLWSYWHRFPLTYFFTILSSSIRCKWPNQLNRCAFMWLITFLCLINSSFDILIACPLQQWLPERAPVLRYTYIACLVLQL